MLLSKIGAFCRGFSWRIFLGTFSPQKRGEKIQWQNPRTKKWLKNKNPRRSLSAKNRPTLILAFVHFCVWPRLEQPRWQFQIVRWHLTGVLQSVLRRAQVALNVGRHSVYPNSIQPHVGEGHNGAGERGREEKRQKRSWQTCPLPLHQRCQRTPRPPPAVPSLMSFTVENDRKLVGEVRGSRKKHQWAWEGRSVMTFCPALSPPSTDCVDLGAPNPANIAPTCTRRPKQPKQTCTNLHPQALLQIKKKRENTTTVAPLLSRSVARPRGHKAKKRWCIPCSWGKKGKGYTP